MTLAICLNCGGQKHGALTICTSCQFTPGTEVELAKSMLLSDHGMTHDQLTAISARIKSGETPDFDDAEVEEMIGVLREEHLKMPLGCVVAVWTPFVVLFILLVWLAVLYFT